MMKYVRQLSTKYAWKSKIIKRNDIGSEDFDI